MLKVTRHRVLRDPPHHEEITGVQMNIQDESSVVIKAGVVITIIIVLATSVGGMLWNHHGRIGSLEAGDAHQAAVVARLEANDTQKTIILTELRKDVSMLVEALKDIQPTISAIRYDQIRREKQERAKRLRVEKNE